MCHGDLIKAKVLSLLYGHHKKKSNYQFCRDLFYNTSNMNVCKYVGTVEPRYCELEAIGEKSL